MFFQGIISRRGLSLRFALDFPLQNAHVFQRAGSRAESAGRNILLCLCLGAKPNRNEEILVILRFTT